MSAKRIRPERAGIEFMERTYYKYAVPSDQSKRGCRSHRCKHLTRVRRSTCPRLTS